MLRRAWELLNSNWIGLLFSGIKKSDLDLTFELRLQPIDLMNGCERQMSIDDTQIEVTIPAGINYGQKIRLRGYGNECPYRVNKRGDLYLLITE